MAAQIFLFFCCATGLAQRYQIATLTQVVSSSAGGSHRYDLTLQYGGRTRTLRLTEDGSYRLPWHIDDTVEFRSDESATYLKQPNGHELKIPRTGPASAAANRSAVAPALAAAPVLPFPSTNRGSIDAPTGTSARDALPLTRPLRCDEIAALGPEFQLLGNACMIALAPETLPNYLCDETTRRWVNERPHDTVTDVVNFVSGRDRRSKLAIDGRPVETLAGAGGFISSEIFGSQLRTIFRPETETVFRFEGGQKVGGGETAVFTFHYESANNHFYRLNDLFPSLDGTIWVDPASGQLMRVEAHAVDTEANPSFSSYRSAVNYDDVAIPELGTFLLPTDAQVQMCMNGDSHCLRNVIAFRSCRKFGATSRVILPPGW